MKKPPFALSLVLAASTLAACSSMHSNMSGNTSSKVAEPQASITAPAPVPAAQTPAPTPTVAVLPAIVPVSSTPQEGHGPAPIVVGTLSTSPDGEKLDVNNRALPDTGKDAASENAIRRQLAELKRTVYFGYDKYALAPADQAILKAHAAYLAKHPQAHVRLEGNTDEHGSPQYNQALGERRAKAVQAYLLAHGVAADQLEIVSTGEAKPIVHGRSPAAEAKNRRVVFDYVEQAG